MKVGRLIIIGIIIYAIYSFFTLWAKRINLKEENYDVMY